MFSFLIWLPYLSFLILSYTTWDTAEYFWKFQSKVSEMELSRPRFNKELRRPRINKELCEELGLKSKHSLLSELAEHVISQLPAQATCCHAQEP